MDDNFSFENFPHGSGQSGNQEFQKVMLRGRGGKAPLGNHMWGQRSRVRYIYSSFCIFCTRKKATRINHTTRSPLVSFSNKDIVHADDYILGYLLLYFFGCFSFCVFCFDFGGLSFISYLWGILCFGGCFRTT